MFSNWCSFLEWATNETPLSLINKLLLSLVLCLFISILVCIVPCCVLVATPIGCWARTVGSAWHAVFVATLSAACFSHWLVATVYDINETLGCRRPMSTRGDDIPPFTSQSNSLISTFGGPCWSAAFHSMILRCALRIWRYLFGSVKGNAMMHIGFLFFLE